MARKVMEAFAICTYRTSRKQVEARLLKLVHGDPKEAVLGLARHNCLRSGELRFDPTTFRGSLFVVMYRNHFKRPVADIATASTVDYGQSTDLTYAIAMKFADCVVRADPKNAVELVNASPATSGEGDVLRSLSPAMSYCVSKGRSSQMHKSTFRGFIAESLFKLSAMAATKAPR